MILDYENLLCEDQQTGSGDSSTLSEHTYDAGSAIDLGAGNRPKATLRISAVGTASRTMDVQLIGASNEALSANVLIIGSTGAAERFAGDLLEIPVVRHADRGGAGAGLRRYFGYRFVEDQNSTQHTMTGGLVWEPQENL